MSIASFQNIVHALAELGRLQTYISVEVELIRSEHEALLTEFGKIHDSKTVPHDRIQQENPTKCNPVRVLFGTSPHARAMTPPLVSDRVQEVDERHAKGLRSELCKLALKTSTAASGGDVQPPDIKLSFDNEEAEESCGQSSGQGPLMVWPLWQDESEERLSSRTSATFIRDRVNHGAVSASLRAGDEVKGNGCMQRLVIQPSSLRRVCWDIASMLALMYDVCVIPLYPFDLPESDFTNWMNVTTTIFWSFDVYLSFTTGFHKMGTLEMRLEKIAKRYVCSWFFLDVSVAIIDYLLLFVEASGSIEFLSFLRVGKSIRLIRIVRVFRLLRLQKALTILSNLSDAIFSEAISTAFGILKLITVIVIAAHLLACGWYAVGIHTYDTEADTWVKALEAREPSETSFAWLYTTSLHWSITQFTPASMEVFPRNPFERCYALGVIVIALVSFSSFLSSITSSMTFLRSQNLEYKRQRELLRRYILQQRVSLDLGNRIQAFFRQIRRVEKRTQRLHEAEVPVISALPDAYRVELHGQVYAPMIDSHPLFSQVRQIDNLGLLALCHNTMNEHRLSCHQELFTDGDHCNHMYFVLYGELDYFHLSGGVLHNHVAPGNYLCEMCLWVRWDHQGRLVAFENCEIVGLDSQQFRAVASNVSSFVEIKKYARLYASRLIQGCDIAVPYDTWSPLGDLVDIAQSAFDLKQAETASTISMSTAMSVATRLFFKESRSISRQGSKETDSSHGSRGRSSTI